MIKEDFTKCVSKHVVHVSYAYMVVRIIVCLQVDDLLITSANEVEIRRIKLKLIHEFEMSNLGNLSYSLGMEFKDTCEGVFLH